MLSRTPSPAPVVLPGRPSWLRVLGLSLALAVGYAALGRLGLLFATHHESATIVWPPTGLAIAALLLGGRRLWPGVLLGALAVNLSLGTAPLAALGITVGNTLEAVCAAWLLERFGVQAGLARLRDVLGFFLLACLLSTTVSATIGVGSLLVSGGMLLANAPVVWLDWWLGDAGGALVVAPMVLVVARGTPAWGELLKRAETWLVFASLGLALALAFGGALAPPFDVLASFAPIALVVWAGLRLGPRGAVSAAALTFGVVVFAQAAGGGPLPEDYGHLFTLAYGATVGVIAMVVAAAVAERDAATVATLAAVAHNEQLEQQLRHTQRLESLGVLAGGVAHDFNNLLLVIRANAELVKMGLEDRTPAVEQMLEDIDTATVQATGLCDQLLTYAGHSRPTSEPVQLAELASEMQSLLRSFVGEKKELNLDLPADLPAVSSDPTQLGQVLLNLVLNASEAIGDEAGRIDVRARVQDITQAELAGTFLHSDAPAGRYLVLEVEDDGPGMSEQTLQRVFDPFFTTKFTGRGLGMASVLGIVTGHRGAIKVASELGVGTSMRVLLPLEPALSE